MVENDLEKCIQLIDDGNYQDAIICLDKEIAKNPQNKEALYLKGMAYFDMDDPTSAIEFYDKALLIDPDYIDVLNDKGVALINLEKFNSAKKCFKKTIELDSNYAFGWNNLGVVLFSLDDVSEAIKHFDKAIELDINLSIAQYFKGLSLESTGKDKEALKAYDEALKNDPNNIDYLNAKSNVLINLNMNKKGIELIDKVLSLDSEDNFALYNKGRALRELNKYADALECYDRIILIDPEDIDAWYQKGNVLRELNNDNESLKAYKTFVELVEKNDIVEWKLVAKRVKEYIRMKKEGEEVRVSPPEKVQYWQWVTKPEFYINPDGTDNKYLSPDYDPEPGSNWTCHKDTRIGDLILLYRAGKKNGVTYQDIKYLIQAQSDAYTLDYDEQAFEHGWQYGCDYKPLFKFENSINYHELMEDPYLEDWNALRKRFQGIAFKTEERHWKRLQELLSERNPDYKEFLNSFKPKEVIETYISEKKVEEKLSKNLDVLKNFGYDLKLLGRQVRCIGQGGRIDLLCEDNKDKSLVVIELKIVKATRNTFGQIANYVGWAIRRKADGKDVKGIVISKGYDNEFDSAQFTNDKINYIELADVLDELGIKMKY